MNKSDQVGIAIETIISSVNLNMGFVRSRLLQEELKLFSINKLPALNDEGFFKTLITCFKYKKNK